MYDLVGSVLASLKHMQACSDAFGQKDFACKCDLGVCMYTFAHGVLLAVCVLREPTPVCCPAIANLASAKAKRGFRHGRHT